MNRSNEDIFVQAICAHLDASIESLDPALEARLHAMRQAAVSPLTHYAPDTANDALLLHVRESFDAAPELAPAIKSRLDAARLQAVAKMRQRDGSLFQIFGSRWRYGMASLLDLSRLARPAGMMATACVMVTVVSLFYVSSRPAGTLALEEEIVLIASADDFELYENLEFYLWLAENGLPN